jgi:hypothetical protein
MKNLLQNKSLLIQILSILLVVSIVTIIVIAMGSSDKKSALVNDETVVQVVRKPDDALKVDLAKVDFSAPTSPQSTNDFTAAEKKAIYESLLANFKAYVDKDVKLIRAQSLAKATSPAEKSLINSLSDADLLNLASRISKTLIMPTPEVMLSPSSVWTRDENIVTIKYQDPTLGEVTKKVVNIDGKWY